MSTTIDNRVVEMTFDNKQFEAGVQTSLRTLDKLNEKLKFKNSANSLQELSNRFKNFAFDGMYSGLDALRYRFSNLGIVGATVIQNLTNTAMAFGRNLWANTLGQIKSGGLARAMNIEQAKFQLQGLHVEWDKISSDINYGVQDTAYGLDAAAKAASQLVASGVKFGEEFGTTGNSPMAKALRGISGVAAMTNSSYEDISHIFTTIAGNGRVMGENLQQFAGRGLNVAATLAEALHTSEEEVRKMVSKGKIDFATFSEIMNDAFGPQAKKANETFTGAMSNVKAALSRIGASFYSPGLVAARDLLNSIRPIINSIHKAMDPMIKDWESLLNNVVPKITSKLDAINANKSIFKNIKLIYGMLKETFGFVFRYVDRIRMAFNDIFPKKSFAEISAVLYKINAFISGMRSNVHTLVDVRKTFRGIFAAFDIFRTVISSVIRFIGQFTGKGLDMARSILHITGSIGDWIVKWRDYIKTNDSVYKGLNNLVDLIKTKFASVKEHISSFIDSFKAFWTETGRLAELKKAWQGLKDIGALFVGIYTFCKPVLTSTLALFKDIIKGIGTTIIGLKPYALNFLDFVLAIIGQLGTWASKLVSLIEVSDTFRDIFVNGSTSIFRSINNARISVENFFKSFTNKDAQSSILTVDRVRSAASTIEGILSIFAEKVKKIFDAIANILGHAWDRLKAMLNPIVDGLKNAFNSLTFDDFLKAVETGLFGTFLMRFGFFERSLSWKIGRTKKLFSLFGGNFKVLTDSLTSFSKIFIDIKASFSSLITSFSDITKSNVIKQMAVSILILAGAVLILSTIDPKKLAMSLAAIFALGKLLEHFYSMIDEINKKASSNPKEAFKFENISGAFIKFSIALFIMASAVKKLGNMEPEKLGLGMLAMVSMVATLAGAIKFLSTIKFIETKSKGLQRILKSFLPIAVSLYIVAGAIKKLAKLDRDQLLNGLGSILAVMAGLTSVVASLSKIRTLETKSKGIKRILGATVMLSISLSIIAGVIKTLGKIERGSLEKGVISVLVIMGALAAIITALGSIDDIGDFSKGFSKITSGVLVLSVALVIIAQIIKQLGSMQKGSLEKGVISVLVIMGAITILIATLSSIDDIGKFSKGFSRTTSGILVLSVSLLIIAQVIKQLGGMGGENLIAAIGSIIGILTTLGVFAYAMSKIEDVGKTAASLIAMSIALLILSKAMNNLGGMSLSGVGKALLALGGALAILGAAAYLIKRLGLADTLNKLANSILKLGIGVALVGGGVLALSIALSIFAASSIPAATTFITGMTIILLWLKKMSPIIISLIGDAITMFIRYIGQHAGAIVGAVVDVIKAILKGIKDLAPDVIDTGLYIIVCLLKGISDNIYMITECVALIIIRFIAALSQYQDALIDAGLVLIINFINGLANGIREHGDQMLQAIENLVSSIIEFIISALQELVRTIPVIGDGIANYLEETKQGLKEQFSVDEMAQISGDMVEGTAQGLDDHKDRLEQSSRNLIQSAKGAFESESGFGAHFGSVEGFGFAGGFLDASGLASENASFLQASAVTTLENGNTFYSLAGQDNANSYLSGFSSADTTGAADTLSNDMFGSLSGVDFSNASDSQISEYLSNFSNSGDEASGAATSLVDSLVSGLDDNDGEVNNAGEKTGENYSEGVKSKRPSAHSAGSMLRLAASGGASNGYLAMYTNGSNAGRGYYDGVMAWAEPVAKAAARMTNSGINSTANVQQSQSPSKVYTKLGSYAGEGYVNGFADYISVVGNVAKELVGSGIEVAKSGVSKISELIGGGFDDAPVITPVLDLSQIQNGSDSINKMFDDRTFGVAVRRNISAISASEPSRKLDADKTYNGTSQTFNYTQNNYSPKALSRVDIYRQTRNQFAQLKGVAGV